MLGKLLTLFFFFPVFSRSSTAVTVDLTTYGMVGADWSHDRAVAERGKEEQEEECLGVK